MPQPTQTTAAGADQAKRNCVISPITQFRLSYLRAIADAWDDENGDYFKSFVWAAKDKKNDMTEYGDYKLQEEHDIFSIPGLKHFNYANPWNVIVNIIYREGGPKYNGRIWTGSVKKDRFIIFLPPAPADRSKWSEALTEYYEKNPTLFGSSGQDGSISGMGNIGVKESEPLDFINLGGTFLSAIAQAWKDKDYKSALLNADSEEEVTAVLDEAYHGFKNPWNFRLQFKQWPKKNDGSSFPAYKNGWKEFPKNIIQLNYPHKPEVSDITVEPLALASYNATGREYPLTCY